MLLEEGRYCILVSRVRQVFGSRVEEAGKLDVRLKASTKERRG